MPLRKYSKNQVLEAIQGVEGRGGCFGIVSTVASRLQCDWHTARDYVNNWVETRRAFAAQNEKALDLSETKMLEAVNSGDGPMIRFHLATKGKDRGYVQRQEQVLQGDTLEVTTRVVRRPDHASSDD